MIGSAWLLGLAALSTAQQEDRSYQLRLRALSGVDSNVRQSARSQGWAAAALTRADGSARWRLGEDTAGLEGDILLDIGEGTARAHRMALGVEGLWSRFLWGRDRAFGLGERSNQPSLRFDLGIGYRMGLRLDRTAPSPPPPPQDGESDGEGPDGEAETGEEREEDASEADEAGSAGAGPDSSIAFLEPFHDLTVTPRLEFRPGVAGTRFGLRLRLRRSFRSREPGEASRHFMEVGGRIHGRIRLSEGLAARLEYGLELRHHDERSDGRGGRLRYLSHLPRARLDGRWRQLRVAVGYGMRLREANREGRSRLRHALGTDLRWRLNRDLDLLAEVGVSWERRFERRDRDWHRFRSVVGLQIDF